MFRFDLYLFFQSMENTLDIMIKEEAVYQEKTNEKQAHILQLNKEIDQQKPKLERVMTQVGFINKWQLLFYCFEL